MSGSMKLGEVVTIARSLKNRGNSIERFATGHVNSHRGHSRRFQDMPDNLREEMQTLAEKQLVLSEKLMDSTVIIDI